MLFSVTLDYALSAGTMCRSKAGRRRNKTYNGSRHTKAVPGAIDRSSFIVRSERSTSSNIPLRLLIAPMCSLEAVHRVHSFQLSTPPRMRYHLTATLYKPSHLLISSHTSFRHGSPFNRLLSVLPAYLTRLLIPRPNKPPVRLLIPRTNPALIAC